ncbi:unnamed protein product [Polarella glacialis]|uniref:Uncharacterized protein n=1 Tax=Polarella glacialis TaxID=89957 RepID=A0A813LBC3_POLGL|nr:unnamed protein product [Polarella glacialis]
MEFGTGPPRDPATAAAARSHLWSHSVSAQQQQQQQQQRQQKQQQQQQQHFSPRILAVPEEVASLPWSPSSDFATAVSNRSTPPPAVCASATTAISHRWLHLEGEAADHVRCRTRMPLEQVQARAQSAGHERASESALLSWQSQDFQQRQQQQQQRTELQAASSTDNLGLKQCLGQRDMQLQVAWLLKTVESLTDLISLCHPVQLTSSGE